MTRVEVYSLYTDRQLPFPLAINHQSLINMADQAAKLEQYIALAKSARGESAAKLIVNATSAVSYLPS